MIYYVENWCWTVGQIKKWGRAVPSRKKLRLSVKPLLCTIHPSQSLRLSTQQCFQCFHTFNVISCQHHIPNFLMTCITTIHGMCRLLCTVLFTWLKWREYFTNPHCTFLCIVMRMASCESLSLKSRPCNTQFYWRRSDCGHCLPGLFVAPERP